ncbi:unnamed protein product [Lota lota]
MLWSVMGFLLMQGCWGSPVRTGGGGCNTWKPSGKMDVCCQMCDPGYRILRRCGPSLDDLCTPCENGTFTLDPSMLSCTKCKQCGGVQTLVAACTTTKDTQCGCPPELLCNDSHCAICVKQCGIGQEPQGGSCRECPHGTFNDQNHQKCKPWKSICTHPDEYMIMGNRFTDSKCIGNATRTATTVKTTTPRNIESNKDTMLPWVVVVVSCLVLLFPLILMINVVTKLKEKKKGGPTVKQQLFITTPTDEPRTLMAIECSFHEPEQVSSSESLATEDSEGSTQKLIM